MGETWKGLSACLFPHSRPFLIASCVWAGRGEADPCGQGRRRARGHDGQGAQRAEARVQAQRHHHGRQLLAGALLAPRLLAVGGWKALFASIGGVGLQHDFKGMKSRRSAILPLLLAPPCRRTPGDATLSWRSSCSCHGLSKALGVLKVLRSLSRLADSSMCSRPAAAVTRCTRSSHCFTSQRL